MRASYQLILDKATQTSAARVFARGVEDIGETTISGADVESRSMRSEMTNDFVAFSSS
jgi:hypothetical protein